MLSKIQEKFSTLSSREKAIVVAAILAASWSTWDSFIYQPLQLKKNNLQQQLTAINTQVTGQKQTEVLLLSDVNSDPNLSYQNRLTDLKAQYRLLQEQIILGDKKFVPPNQMAKALSDLLAQDTHLTLIKLDKLPTKTLLAGKQQQHPIYKHELVITFSGNYLDTVNYLKSIEALPWAIVWERIDYQVTDYPSAICTINIVTLSFEEGWLGV